MAGPSAPPGVITAFALGPLPSAVGSGTVAGTAPAARHPGFAPAGGDFFRSAAFGFLVLLALFLYLHTRILR